MNDRNRAVVALDAADSKQSADLPFDVRRRRASVQPRRIMKPHPVGRCHSRQEDDGGGDPGNQACHQQSEARPVLELFLAGDTPLWWNWKDWICTSVLVVCHLISTSTTSRLLRLRYANIQHTVFNVALG